VLIQTAKDLEIQLAKDDEGMVKQITAIMAEEKLRAALAEAAYQAHLDSLRHRECIRDDEGLELTAFDNKARDFPKNSGSQPEPCSTKTMKHRASKKRKK
jgi:hypothetical protein